MILRANQATKCSTFVFSKVTLRSGCKPKKLPARVCMALCFPCAVTARHCCLRAPRSSRKPAFGHFLLTLSSSSVTCASQNGRLRPKVADHRGWSPIVCRTETIHTSGRLRGGRRKATKGNGERAQSSRTRAALAEILGEPATRAIRESLAGNQARPR